MTLLKLTTTAAALIAAGVAVHPAVAQQASKPAAKAAAVSITVKVTNGRSAPVTALMLSPQGATDAGPNLLKAPLDGGKTVNVVVKTKKGQCLFDVSGGYDDEVEIAGSGLNLCKDRTLALVD